MPSPASQGFRLSPQQKRVWLLQQESAAYGVQCAIRLEGPLDAKALKAALRQVVRRHDILRTTFEYMPGIKTPLQCIDDGDAIRWEEIDRTGQAMTDIASELEQPFDADVFSATLFRYAVEQHILQLRLPALCADEWTLSELVKELSVTYAASIRDEERAVEVAQYLQFSEWQNALLEDEGAKSGRAYWRDQDLAAGNSLRLPLEGAAKETPFAPATLAVDIDAAVLARLAADAAAEQVPLATYLLACWHTLLWRLTKQPRIIVGQIADGRTLDVLQGALGLFSKWLPIGCQCKAEFTFPEIVQQVHKAVEDGREWQEYFIAEEDLETNGSGLVFPYMLFSYEERPLHYVADELTFSIYQQYVCTERFHVRLSCIRSESTLRAEFHYDAALYSAADIRRLAQQFQTLAGSVAEHKSVRIDELEMVGAAERAQLQEWNRTAVTYRRDECVHELFEQQAAVTPAALALVYEEQHLSYGELNRRANQLAHYLQALGVGPEVRVGLCVERSLEMMVGLLGILKAGGAYVPLDPTHPGKRLSFMLEDTAAQVLLTQERLLAGLPTHQARVVCLDTQWPEIAACSSENPPRKVQAENAAYVIYTSGSTGKPKGVVIEHRQLCNYIAVLEVPASSFATVSTLVADLGNTATLPLGQPLANTTIYLLDDYLRPVPIGVTGELYIGGAGVGRGYLNQSSLTAEKYLPDPFSGQAGARLYRTGDLGRYLADGSIEFPGRKDKQIKLRGYRIELAEIETALRTHAAVREAVVVVREDEAGEKRLVGYVTPHREYSMDQGHSGPVSGVELREYLHEWVPEHMVPSWIVVLNELPPATNGKIDTPIEAALTSDKRMGLPTLTAVKRNGEIPLSFAQQRLWFLDQLEPNNPFYNVPAGVRLNGELNIEALERTLSEIVRRHEVLRTSFIGVAGEPRQVISAATQINLPVKDLSDLPVEERELEAARRAAAEAREPFDLSRGPLLRAQLLRLAAEEHVLLVTMHHIVSDAWSRGVLVREVSTLYEAYCAGLESPLPELAIQYADFAAWQRQWLSGAVLEEQLSYWREQLDGLSTLELPTDRVRPAVQSYRGASVAFSLGREETLALKELSRREGATLFMVLLAAFQILLSRYSGQEDVVVGTPTGGRLQKKLEPLIGFFVNQLVLRTNLSGSPSFRELLKRVREVCFGAYTYQDVPFEKLVEELQPERDLSRTPLFQVMLLLINTVQEKLRLGKLRLTGTAPETTTVKFDLVLSVAATESEMICDFTYDTDLFDRATINRMVHHFKTLLLDIVARPEKSISALSLLTEAERNQIVCKWNETATDYGFDKCLPQLFSEQAQLTPEAVAVVFQDEKLNYRELNEKANQLARLLIDQGVGRNTYVPVLMERSTELVIAWLAIMKAGAAFIPLDPHWPLERLRRLLEELNSTPILVNKISLPQVEQLAELPLLLVKTSTLTGLTGDPHVDIAPGDPIYAIYTSGSTGKPKAAVVAHSGIINRFFWMNDFFGRAAAAATLSTTNPVYDSAVWEVFWPLINGGKTVIPSPQMELTATDLTSVVAEHGVTMLDIVPSGFNAIVPELISSTELQAHLQSVLHLVVGGEEINSAMTYKFAEHFPNIKVTNLYGPTECSIGCICYRLTTEVKDRIPIGKPIANTQVLILDRYMNPVPVGVAGEIYLSGICVGLGYLNDEERTRTAFIDNPLPEFGRRKLYKTGDQARYLPDGNIEYLGRVDEQVKIRGYRIELSEIEAVLSEHPSISQAVVVARATETQERRLVAYVVAQAESNSSEWRQFLRQRLPQYMIPSVFVPLAALPVTTSGKVDRKALPAPEQSQTVSEQYVAPRTATEEIVAGIWARVLELEQVGVHDNFFDLGGHSLLATQVISRAREAFAIELPVRSLFESPTVSGLSSRIEQSRLAGTQNVAPPLLPRDKTSEEQIPLSFAQQRLWFLDQLEPNNPFYNIPTGVRLSGELNIEALGRTLSEIMRRHEVLRTSFITVAGEPRQVIGAATEIKLPVEDLSFLPVKEREEETERRAAAEAHEPFDLSRGPLLRARLLRLAADEHVLLVTMHHIMSDGWSMGVLVREVSALYEAYCAGAESPLPELAIQYADFTVWQRQWLSGAVLEEQLNYWREQLRDLSTLELPADRVRPAVQSYRGATVGFAVGREETAALKELCRREGATLFMVLLAAFQVLLSRYSGQSDVVIGTPIANRSHTGTEALIGFFVNTLVLRINLDGQASFQQLVKHVREVCLEAYAYQDVPFEKLVEELQPKRDLSRSPLFQVMLIFQNAPGGTLRMGNLGLSSAGGAGQTTKFDLLLDLSESHEGLRGGFRYSTDLFDESTIVQLIEHFKQLLRGLTTAPELRLTQISMLTPAEREQLRAWNQTGSDFPPVLLHEAFAEQARQRPEATALIYEDERMSYGELERRANQLAHHLQRLGVGPDVLVGICLERSPQMVVALLAVLKAGGAYLPLDPAYPPERLSFMLEDAAVKVLLSRRELLTRLTPAVEHCVCLDEEWEQIAIESEATPACAAVPENLAYVIYTSGSTGQPKGVMGLHRSTLNRFNWMWNAFPFTDSDVCCQKTSLNFGDSIWEIFGPLLKGIPLVIIPAAAVKDPQRLVEALSSHNVTRLVLVPSLLRMLLESDIPLAERLPHLNHWVCSGERLTRELSESFAGRLPGRVLLNLYGSSEVAADVTYHIAGDEVNGQRVPIGRPIANTEIYVLDEELELVPIGVHGEIYVGGVALARGYLQRAALTAERFIPDPFSGRVGARLYRTGDEGRYRADGNVEYRGRLDQQVKLRGYRIELGEIEAVLGQHEAVAQCVVNLRETETADQRLVGYVVWESGQESTVTELRQYLSDRLPEYMVPAQWVVLEELPSTASGKLDRRALPAPGNSITDEESLVGPRDWWELKLLQIWEEVLSIHPVGVTDNFFDLGGHSLLAVRLLARIEHVFDKKLPLASLFQGGTIERLAQLLRYESDVLWSSLVPIQPKGTKPPLFCIHPAGGGVLGYIHLARALGEDQPLYGLQTRGLDGRQPLYSRIEDMAAHYIEEIKSVQPEGPYLIAGTSLGGMLAFEVAQQLNAQNHEVALLALLDPGSAGTDLEQRPMTEFEIIAGVGAAMGLDLSSSDFYELSTDEQLTVLLEHARGKNRITADVDLAEARHLLRVFKTNVDAADAYVPQRYPGRAAIVRATEELERHGDDLTLGWGALLAQGAEVHFAPGDHTTFLGSANATETARVVHSLLEAAFVKTSSATVPV